MYVIPLYSLVKKKGIELRLLVVVVVILVIVSTPHVKSNILTASLKMITFKNSNKGQF